MDAAHHDEPRDLTGFKRAYVIVAPDRSSARFYATQAPVSYKTTDHARCVKLFTALGDACEHPASDPECTCGFYGIFDEEAIVKGAFAGSTYRRAFSPVVLNIQGWGSVIEGPVGFRASSQTTLSVTFDPQCYYCNRRAQHLMISAVPVSASGRAIDHFESGVIDTEVTSWHGVRAVCGMHRRREPDAVETSLSELSGLLGVDVDHGTRLDKVPHRRPPAEGPSLWVTPDKETRLVYGGRRFQLRRIMPDLIVAVMSAATVLATLVAFGVLHVGWGWVRPAAIWFTALTVTVWILTAAAFISVSASRAPAMPRRKRHLLWWKHR